MVSLPPSSPKRLLASPATKLPSVSIRIALAQKWISSPLSSKWSLPLPHTCTWRYVCVPFEILHSLPLTSRSLSVRPPTPPAFRFRILPADPPLQDPSRRRVHPRRVRRIQGQGRRPERSVGSA